MAGVIGRSGRLRREDIAEELEIIQDIVGSIIARGPALIALDSAYGRLRLLQAFVSGPRSTAEVCEEEIM